MRGRLTRVYDLEIEPRRPPLQEQIPQRRRVSPPNYALAWFIDVITELSELQRVSRYIPRYVTVQYSGESKYRQEGGETRYQIVPRYALDIEWGCEKAIQRPGGQVSRLAQVNIGVGATKAGELNGHGGVAPNLLRALTSKYSSPSDI